jgi:hypothetical protein
MHRVIRLVAGAAVGLLAAGLVGCSGPTDGFDGASPGDGGGRDAVDERATCRTNAECDDRVFCNGEERCISGRCSQGLAACDDEHSCTRDSCDEAAQQCAHTPDHAMCGDMNACNGVEVCDPSAPGSAIATGCTPVRRDNVVDCDDRNNCTVDTCDAVFGCVHAARDLDGDGHVDRTCTLDGAPGGAPGDDCNDTDPDVYPGALEVCDDGRDNNCDGRTDFADTTTCRPTNDACTDATLLPGAGAYWGSTAGLADDYALGCNPGALPDAVFEFTLATPQDVTVSTTAPGTTSAVALASSCAPYIETRCGRGNFSATPQVRVHSLPAGTHRIIVETGTAGPFRLTLRLDPPTSPPPDDVCPSPPATSPAVELGDGLPHTTRLADLEDDYLLGCNSSAAGARDGVLRLTLAATSDVDFTITSAVSGSVFASLRNAPCAATAGERLCRSAAATTGLALRPRALPAGTYWLLVEHSTNADVTVTARITAPPMPRNAGDVCPAGATAAVELNDGLPHTLRLADMDDDFRLSCNATAAAEVRDVVYRLTLAAASDVSFTVATSASGAMFASLRESPCETPAAERLCRSAFGTAFPLPLRQRSLPAGTYWLVVEATSVVDVTVTAAVTSPPAPTVVYTASTPTGVTFVDACAAPGHTNVLALVDDGSDLVASTAIPFPVRIYDTPLATSLTISSNGYVVFGTATSLPRSGAVPDPNPPNLLVAAYWLDLVTRTNGVCLATTGAAPDRQFVMQWDDVRHFSGGSEHLTFEIVVHEAATPTANNTIDLIYQTMTGAVDLSAAGIENDLGDLGTAVGPPWTTPRVVRLTPM